jgi:hypothetical protein
MTNWRAQAVIAGCDLMTLLIVIDYVRDFFPTAKRAPEVAQTGTIGAATAHVAWHAGSRIGPLTNLRS